MKIPIRILVGQIGTIEAEPKWGDIIDSWESYAVVWNQSNNLGVDPTQAPVLDMFGDEGISIKSIVKDMSDPKKLFTDFSKSFTIPASKKNNRIFKHYYNIDIQNGLDTRELIPAKILMNNTTYKEGNLKVESVRMMGGVPQQYAVTFIGKLSELTRQMGIDRLSSLDFSALDNTTFDYKAEIADTTKRAVMFPLGSRADRYVYDNSANSLNIENTRNIGYFDATPAEDYGIRERDAVGALSVGTILDTIETKYGFNFTGALTADYFRDLYLWLHQTDKTRTGELLEAYATGLTGTAPHWTTQTDSLTFLGTGGVPETEGHERYLVKVKGTWTGEGKIQILKNGNVVREVEDTGVWSSYVAVPDGGVGDIWTFKALNELSIAVPIEANLLIQQYEREEQNGGQTGYFGIQDYTITGSANVGTAGTFIISGNLPKMKVIDFLSSLFKMYNIVAEIDANLNISTKHYDHFMSEGTLKDVTKYVEVAEYEVSRPNVYSSLQMEFAEPKVALEQGFLAVNGRQYGEISYQLAGAEGVKLSGSEYKLKVDNQRIPIEPLNNLADNSPSGIGYVQFSDLKGAEQSIDPMFTYIQRNISGLAISFNDALVTTSATTYTMPCNTFNASQNNASFVDSLVGLYFGQELNEYNTNETFSGISLWNSFYQGTTAMMFDEDKRRVKFSAKLPQGVIIDLKLSDVLHINNAFYNINSIETNYLSGVSKLDLTLVGRSRLKQFYTGQVKVYNTSATDILYITYINNSTGELTKGSISVSANATFDMVGNLCGRSHDLFTTDNLS